MREYRFVRSLKDLNKQEFSVAGGKGANLGEMIKANLPVPEGFVLLTNSYQRFVEVNDLEREINNLLAMVKDDFPEGLIKASEQIRRFFLQGEMPGDIKTEIDRCYAELGGPAVAVRSSATAEDLPQASFAGQYTTFLNVKGKEELYASIRKCWASLWNERAECYRAKHNIDSKDLALGVVVQKLINSEKSGLMFTANPVNGRRDEVSLNSSWGLGEAVVSGEVDPDQWVINKNSKKIVSEYIASKKVKTVTSKEGIQLVKVEEEKQEQATLNEEEHIQLLYLARRVEECFGLPQDIEWTFAEGQFYIVQTRPITSLFPMLQPGDSGEGLRIYMNFMMYRQGMSAPLTPMGIEFMVNALKVFLLKHKYRNKPVRWLKSAGGRLFVDATEPLRYEAVLARLRSYRIPALMDTEPVTLKALLQVAEKNQAELKVCRKPVVSLLIGLLTRMSINLVKVRITSWPKVMYGRLFPLKAVNKAAKDGNSQLAAMLQRRIQLQTITDKLDFVEQEASTVTFKIGYGMIFWLMSPLSSLTQARKILSKYQDDTSDLEKVARAVPDSVTTEMGMELLQIAKKLDQTGKEPTPDQGEVKGFLEKYGHRSCEEIDIGVPRWKEDPEYVLDIIRAYIDRKSYNSGIEKFHRNLDEAEKTIEKIVSQLRQRGTHRDAKRIEKLLRIHRKTFGARELPKFVLVKGISILREVLAEIGEELQARGRLDHPEDIFFVSSQDIRSEENLQEMVKDKREAYRRELKRTPVPRIITSTGETIYASMEDECEEVCRGIPASPGVLVGLVRVLKGPGEGSKLKQGEILVAASTNPAWTPLFLRISGLIMETGAPMSHGPVVAREYGIPAVVGVKGATTRFKDGDIVRINGESGRIEILSGDSSQLKTL